MNYSYQKRIRDLREDSDKTQQEIADILGTSQTMYARYERGANEIPVHHIITLCRYYRVSADYILGLSDKRQKITIFITAYGDLLSLLNTNPQGLVTCPWGLLFTHLPTNVFTSSLFTKKLGDLELIN